MVKSVFIFNHISNNINIDDVEKLKKLYKHYHRQHTCYKWKFKRLKRIKLSLNMSSIVLAVTGTTVGAATMNPIILGVLSGSGILIQGYLSKSEINKKVEACRFAYTSYKKILTELKSYLRGMLYEETVLLSKLQVLDDTITDLCPPVDSLFKKYDKIYTSQNH